MTPDTRLIIFVGEFALNGSEEVGFEKQLSESFLHEFCFPTVEAIDLLCGWVEKLKTNNTQK